MRNRARSGVRNRRCGRVRNTRSYGRRNGSGARRGTACLGISQPNFIEGWVPGNQIARTAAIWDEFETNVRESDTPCKHNDIPVGN